MKHLKTFESYSVNEEFNKFDIIRWMTNASGVLSTALNLVLLKWNKIPGIWKNIGEYKKFMNVLEHLKEVSDLGDMNEEEWKDLIRVGKVRHSTITSGPSVADLSIYYTLTLYHDKYNSDLKEDIITSIHMINNLEEDRKKGLKDVLELIKSFLNMIDAYESNGAEEIIDIDEVH